MKHLLLFLLCLAPAALANPPTLQPHTAWPVLQAPADPPRIDNLPLHPVWQLDCGEDSEHLVGKIRSAAPGRDGRILLVDSQLCQVMVVGADGSVEQTIGQCGEGPGELEGAYRTLQLPDGRIGIASGAQAPGFQFGTRGRIILLDDAGNPAGVWLAGGGDPGDTPACSVRALRYAGGPVLTATHRYWVSPPTILSIREIGLIDPATGNQTLVARDVLESSFDDTEFFERDVFEPFAHGRVDVSATGRVAFAPERDRWLVAIREADGSGFAVERPCAAVKRTDVEKEAAAADIGCGTECVEDDHPVIRQVRWRPDGQLWVEIWGLELAAGVVACFDEFGTDGVLVRRVQLEVPDARASDELVLMEDGRFVLLRGFGEVGEDETDGAVEVMLLES